MANVAEYVRIILASEFKAKAFNDADKAVTKLNKNVKNLAKGFGVALGARALANYSKAAVKAFAEDENAARSLSMTLENLGLAYGGAAKSVNDYISTLEKQTGVLDDELRPAMDRFLRATYDVTKSQELLSLALDISAGTGKDLTAVSQALQKAYLGQTQSLGRLGVGLSKAELTGSTFLELQQKLSTLFSGQAASAADSYQGSLNKLTVAANNAKEAIGKGLVDALAGAGGGGQGGLNATLNAVEKSAQAVSDLLVGIGRTIGAINAGTKTALSGKGFISGFSSQSAAYRQQDLMARQQYGGVYALKYQKEAAALAKKQQTITKAQVTATKQLTATQKEALKEKKLSAIFDQEQIQIMAALQGKISNEERKRLELMLALNTGNVSAAEKLSKELAAAQGINSLIATQLRDLPDAENPFKSWGDYLKAIEEQIARISGAGNGTNAGDVPLIPSNVSPSYTGDIPPGYKSSYTASPVLEINVNGDGAIANVIRDALNEAAASGKTTGWSQSATIQVLN